MCSVREEKSLCRNCQLKARNKKMGVESGEEVVTKNLVIDLDNESVSVLTKSPRTIVVSTASMRAL